MDKISFATGLGYSSLLCSSLVWIEAVAQAVLSGSIYEPSLRRWMVTLVLSIVLAIAAAVRGPRRWALVALWPIGTLLLLDYIVGS